MNSNIESTQDFDWDLYEDNGKYNTRVKITEEDRKAGVKVLCKEPYAQELYDKMKEFEGRTGRPVHAVKDLKINSPSGIVSPAVVFSVIHV